MHYSVILAGKFGVGKSCLFKRLKSGEVPEGVAKGMSRSSSTWGDDDGGLDNFIFEREIDGRTVKVSLWDTGSQERYESMTANYYRNAHGVIFVYSLDDESSLYALNEWAAEAKKLSRQGERLVMSLWGSKSDLPTQMHAVKEDAVKSFATSHRISEKLECRVTVLDDSVEQAMLELIRHVDKQFSGEPTENKDAELLKLSEPAPTQPALQDRIRACCRLSS